MSLSGDASLQDKMRLGEVVDCYYYSSKTLEKQAIPTVQDTRFVQAFPSLYQGSSTFIISPDQGISDVIIAVKLPSTPADGGGSGAAYNGLALNRGWLASLVRQVSVRYGGSSQYFWTGQQIFVENMREASNPQARDALVELAGAELLKPTDYQGDNMYAYLPLNLPHSSPNGSLEKPNPFPSELLNQPIVITVEMNSLDSIFKRAIPVVADQATAPMKLAEAYFQVRQVHAHDAGELMRPMGHGAGYSYPLKAFYQNQIDVPLASTTSEQSITLTGLNVGLVCV